jgi:ATP-binding cassette subfamily B protein
MSVRNDLREARKQLAYVPRALQLVWGAAPALTAAWGALLVVDGLLPVGFVYLTRLLVDNLVTTIGAGVSWDTIRPAVLVAAVMAAILVARELVQLAVAWIRTAQSELIGDEIRRLVHARAYAADLAFYESPDYHDRLHRASTDASRRPLALLENGGSLLKDGVTLVGMAALVIPYGAWVPLVLVLSTLPALYVVILFNRRLHGWWEDALRLGAHLQRVRRRDPSVRPGWLLQGDLSAGSA